MDKLIYVDTRAEKNSGISTVSLSLKLVFEDYSNYKVITPNDLNSKDREISIFSFKEQFFFLKFLINNRKRKVYFVSSYINTPWLIIFFRNTLLISCIYEDLDYTPGELGFFKKIIFNTFKGFALGSSNMILCQAPKLITELERNSNIKFPIKYVHWPVLYYLNKNDEIPNHTNINNKDGILVPIDIRPRKNINFIISLVKHLRINNVSQKISLLGTSIEKLVNLMGKDIENILNKFNIEILDKLERKDYLKKISSSKFVLLGAHTEYEYSVILKEAIWLKTLVIAPHNDFWGLVDENLIYRQSSIPSAVKIVKFGLELSNNEYYEIENKTRVTHENIEKEAIKSITDILF